MSRRRSHSRTVRRVSVEFMGETVQDLRSYFLAIRSYPEHAASRRGLDFQQHLLSVMGESQSTCGQRPSAE
jgi:hypothetical protein